ncbi:transcription factor WRKY19-like [Zingiber officinale]|uniref:transcription factor WRKY19-like n=1 Tax=Zingiber officinale TaxID=94328 RepID=UPI001C4D1808|nr:transcription factor WRKY19-like [Zingiber officinale]
METNACAAALLAELSQAKELLKELELNLHCLDLCKALTPRIASSIHNSFLMAESFSTKAGHDQSLFSSLDLRPRTLTPRRRMSLLRSWRCQVRLSSVSGGVKGQGEDDGFTWRKYGQKEILGAKYPRAYFRCAHRASRGCPAKKQVQRSDDDPSVYDVTYHGDHTCLEQHDQEQSAAALKVEGEEEYFVGQIAPSFGPMEEQFFSSSPYQFGSFHGAESSSLPMEFEGDGEIDPVSIWAGVEWMA